MEAFKERYFGFDSYSEEERWMLDEEEDEGKEEEEAD